MRRRILKKLNVLAYLSIISILLFSINISKATDITGAVQNGNVYTIAPEKYNNSNTTGFKQYSNFSLSENDIANLQFKNGMTKFVNIVNSNVSINGILNSINQDGQFHNGKVIFLSKGDFIVGQNALINVGALGVYTSSILPDIDNLASLSESQLNNTLDSLKNNLAYNITINGKILSRNEVELYGSTLYTGSNSKIITGFTSKDTSLNSQEIIATKTSVTEARTVADNLISSIVNLGNNKEAILNSNYKFSSQEGKITILSMGETQSSLAGFIQGNGDINIITNNGILLKGNINNLSGDINISTSNIYTDLQLSIMNTNIKNHGNITINSNNNKLYIIDTDFYTTLGNINLYHYGDSPLNTALQLKSTTCETLNGDINIINNSYDSLILENVTLKSNNINIFKSAQNEENLVFDKILLKLLNTFIAKNDINLQNEGDDGIVINLEEGSIFQAENIDIKNNNSILTISEHANLQANNNINIDSTGEIVISGNLNANNDINISEDGNADLTLDSNSVIKAGNEILINNNPDSESNINLLGSIISENDIIIDNKSKGDINIDGEVISNLNNITIANGVDDYIDNVNITNYQSGNVNINGNIISNLDINILNNGIKDINISNSSYVKSCQGNIYIISSDKAKDINVAGNINAKEKLSIESGLNGKINIENNSKIVSQSNDIEVNQSKRSISGIKRDLKTFILLLNTDQNKNIDNKIINSMIKESSLSPSQIISSGNFKDYELIKSKNNNTFSKAQLKIKRESQRYEVANTNMEFYFSSPNIVRVIDISKSGMGIQYNKELNIGEKIDIVVNYNGTSLFATAIVVRLDRERKIAGLKFVNIDEKAANEMLFFNMRN